MALFCIMIGPIVYRTYYKPEEDEFMESLADYTNKEDSYAKMLG